MPRSAHLKVMKPLIIVVASVAIFLITAKIHGRELRLEREAKGYMQVVFGGSGNPPEVEQLWAAERTRFWSITAGLGVVALALGLALGAGKLITIAAIVSWAPSLAFLIGAALSAMRRS